MRRIVGTRGRRSFLPQRRGRSCSLDAEHPQVVDIWQRCNDDRVSTIRAPNDPSATVRTTEQRRIFTPIETENFDEFRSRDSKQIPNIPGDWKRIEAKEERAAESDQHWQSNTDQVVNKRLDCGRGACLRSWSQAESVSPAAFPSPKRRLPGAPGPARAAFVRTTPFSRPGPTYLRYLRGTTLPILQERTWMRSGISLATGNINIGSGVISVKFHP
ncbi:Hypothetical protein NTJ_07019 [Nesidiocoris tenuis]|uniref:Uncharacterized protein n=1 Tax=Nesidiocoris tenuis TaxID=355587 RepID=A0ABN7APR5_9HEMI|nr:Hypothetical protein NTJ_07019 [Nesidiocoris tenuis]